MTQRIHMRHSVKLLLAAFIILSVPSAAQTGGTLKSNPTTDEWSAYGHDQLGGRFSPASQINRANVNQLTPAWTFRTGEIDIATRKPAKLEATPLMVDGTLYLSTPLGRVIALDPATGAVRWKFELSVDLRG